MNLLEEIGNLGENLSDDNKQFFFWQAMKTMPEQRFSLFTENEHDKYCSALPGTKLSIDQLIKLFKEKEINMAAEGTWKKLLSEQAQIIFLVAMIGKGHSNNGNGGNKKRETKNDNGKSDSSSELTKKNKRIKPWMLEKPGAGEPKSKTVNDRQWHWCHKCNDGNGRWVRHQAKNHDDSKKWSNSKKDGEMKTEDSDAPKKKKQEKSAKKSNNGSSSKSKGSEGELKFNRSALLLMVAGIDLNTRAFLSQFVPNLN